MVSSTTYTNILHIDNPRRSIKAYKLSLEKDGRPHEFTLTPQPDSVAVLLYHRRQGQILLLKHFRLAIHVSRVLQRPENKKKNVENIVWSHYEKLSGVRLCAGFVDYTMQSIEIVEETALDAVDADFGLRLHPQDLQHIETFLIGVTEFGARCHLYYAEFDEVIKTREDIKHTWLSEGEVRQLLKSEAPLISSSDYYALLWWFTSKKHVHSLKLRSLELRSGGFNNHRPQLSEGSISEISPSQQQPSYTFHLDIGNNMTKPCDVMHPRFDTLAVLIKDIGDERSNPHKEMIDRLVVTRRFRPATWFARSRDLADTVHLNTSFDSCSLLNDLWYTIELASGKAEEDEDDRSAILRIAANQLGYRIPMEKLKYVRKLVIGSSNLGDSVQLYYAECGKKDQIKGWENGENEEGVMMMQYPCAMARKMIENQVVEQPLPPSVFIAFQSVLNDVPSKP